MRRITAVTMAALLTVVLGCGDGPFIPGSDITPEATGVNFSPEAGSCQVGVGVRPSSYRLTACANPHTHEILHVGAFEGADAAMESPPKIWEPAMRRAYETCDRAAVEYVGGEWNEARLTLDVQFPLIDGWDLGQRWFSCTIAEYRYFSDSSAIHREGSVKGALATRSPLHHGCFESTKPAEGQSAALLPIDCAKVHRVEFVGVWRAPSASRTIPEEQFTAECSRLVTRYVGLPASARPADLVDLLWSEPTEQEWQVGGRAVLCFLSVDASGRSRSLRGAGLDGLRAG